MAVEFRGKGERKTVNSAVEFGVNVARNTVNGAVEFGGMLQGKL
jgi:hypothetical protein